MRRALIVVRLSRVTDATTSPERQLQACRELCGQRGYSVVGIAQDLDVSAGATTPFDRPQLGDWLNNRLGEFDVIVVFRMDRIVRKLLDLADLIRWCQNNAVALVSATESFLDLTSEFGDIIALFVAKVAEMELNAISERNSSAFRHNFAAGKFRGGMPPWGYLPEKDAVTGEWRLKKSLEQAALIMEVVDRVLAGEPLRAIANDLTAREILTPRDVFAVHQGREAKGYMWHSGPLRRSLVSQTLLGYAVTREPLVDAQGRPQRDAKGKKIFGPEQAVLNADFSPVVRAEPILKPEVFERVRIELESRENRKEPTKRSTGLLLQVVFCGACGRPAYRFKGGTGRTPRYRCASAQYKDVCQNGSISLYEADRLVTAGVMSLVGDSERLVRVWDTGTDHSAELTELNDRLVFLTKLVGTAAYRAGTPQQVELVQQIDGLAARQAELSAEAVKPAGWTWQGTGAQFSDWWEAQDVTAQNVWLRSMNIKLTFDIRDGHQRHWHLDLGDLETMGQGLKAGKRLALRKQLLAAFTENGIAGMETHTDGTMTFHPKDQSLEPLHLTKEELTAMSTNDVSG